MFDFCWNLLAFLLQQGDDSARRQWHGRHDLFLLEPAIFFCWNQPLLLLHRRRLCDVNQLHPAIFFATSVINFCWNQHERRPQPSHDGATTKGEILQPVLQFATVGIFFCWNQLKVGAEVLHPAM